MNTKNVLGVFAKQPVPGLVKSRLAAGTSPEWAARVAEAFLLDWTRKLTGFPARTVLVYSPTEAEAYFKGVAGAAFDLEAQTTGDLGTRMKHFFNGMARAGADKTVIIGTDSPTLPLEFIRRAFAELEHADVVLGPATDGGYYLIGCARDIPDVFDGIPWGEAGVLQHTVERLKALDTRFVLLPMWYDVDTMDDWKMLCAEILRMRSDDIDPGLPHTEKLIGRE